MRDTNSGEERRQISCHKGTPGAGHVLRNEIIEMLSVGGVLERIDVMMIKGMISNCALHRCPWAALRLRSEPLCSYPC